MSTLTGPCDEKLTLSRPKFIIIENDSGTSVAEGRLESEGSGANTSVATLKSLAVGVLLGATLMYSRRYVTYNNEYGTRDAGAEIDAIRSIAELKAWLQGFWGRADELEDDQEFRNYIQHQLNENFVDFSRSLKSLSSLSERDVPLGAVAQILVDSSELADIAQRPLLANSVESFLDSQSPLLIDAAARSLSPSRLRYVHAAKKLKTAAEHTKFRYLRRKLLAVHDQLIGG